MNPHTICHDRGVRTVAVSTLPSFYSKSSGSDDYAVARADVGGQTSSSRTGCIDGCRSVLRMQVRTRGPCRN